MPWRWAYPMVGVNLYLAVIGHAWQLSVLDALMLHLYV